MGGYVQIRGLEIVISNFYGLQPRQMQHLKKSMEYAGNVLEEKVKEYAKLEDHTLKDLADMGNPYAWKSGDAVALGDKSQIVKSSDTGPHPDQYIHKQSGKLYDNIDKIVMLFLNVAIVAVGIDENKVPYVPYLIHGTSKMRPRDFLGFAWMDCKDQVLGIIKNGLTPEIGTRGGTTHNIRL